MADSQHIKGLKVEKKWLYASLIARNIDEDFAFLLERMRVAGSASMGERKGGEMNKSEISEALDGVSARGSFAERADAWLAFMPKLVLRLNESINLLNSIKKRRMFAANIKQMQPGTHIEYRKELVIAAFDSERAAAEWFGSRGCLLQESIPGLCKITKF